MNTLIEMHIPDHREVQQQLKEKRKKNSDTRVLFETIVFSLLLGLAGWLAAIALNPLLG